MPGQLFSLSRFNGLELGYFFTNPNGRMALLNQPEGSIGNVIFPNVTFGWSFYHFHCFSSLRSEIYIAHKCTPKISFAREIDTL